MFFWSPPTGLAGSLFHVYPALDFFSKNLELGYQTLRDVLTGLVLLSNCFVPQISPQEHRHKSINNHGPSMQHSTSFRHMLSLRYIIFCYTLLMLYSGPPNLFFLPMLFANLGP